MSVLRLRPWTVKKASALRFNAQVHRRLPKVQGAMWCVSVRNAAGWIEDCLTEGGEYDRPSRQRELQIDPTPKRRWWAPWSKRAPKARAA